MAAIERHITRYVAKPAFVFHEIESTAVHVDVHVVPPGDRHPYNLLFTTGMSARPMSLPADALSSRWAELAMLLPPSWQVTKQSWPVTTIQHLARTPHLDRAHWISAGTTISNGAPIDPSTAFTGVLFWPPSSFPGSISVGNKTVELLTVWPLHDAELAFAREACTGCLIDALELTGVGEILDPGRPSAV